jgi:hypothetical protein
MSTARNIALSLAVLSALALAAGRGEASISTTTDENATILSSGGDARDGGPPTTGPTNPAGA